MLAITIDRHTKPYAVTASIAVTLFATSLQPSLHHLPPLPTLPSNTLLFCSFIWASVSESECLARTCWSRYAHRSAEGEDGREGGVAGGERGEGRVVEAAGKEKTSLQCAPVALRFSCSSGTTLLHLRSNVHVFQAPSCPVSLSLLSLCIMTFTVISLVICKANAANGKIINIKIKL